MKFCNVCHRVYENKFKKCSRCKNKLIQAVESTCFFSNIKNCWVLEFRAQWGKLDTLNDRRKGEKNDD